jgi:hypothetical protein
MTVAKVSKARRRRLPLDIKGLVLEHVARVGGTISGPICSRKQQLLATCDRGHNFTITPHAIIYSGSWCRRCRNGENNAKKRWTAGDLQRVADNFSGRCLTKDYLHAHQKLDWICGSGHRFRRSVTVLKSDPRCPECRKSSGASEVLKKHERAAAIVCKERGGRCLAILPPGPRRQWYARVACKEGHEWEVSCHALIKQNSWCQRCNIASMVENRSYNKSLGLDPFAKIARAQGGELLSTKYKDSTALLRFRCKKGHDFKLRASHARSGHWCPHCGRKQAADARRATIQEIQAEAKRRGGKCLDKEYAEPKKKLTWKCSNPEHPPWENRWHKVKAGQWCPFCQDGFGERVVRSFFQQVFGKPFATAYPIWLKEKKQGRRELDGYEPSLGIAFEHHGRQHYAEDPFFSNTPERLAAIQKRDTEKIAKCKENNVVLIVVPEVGGITPLEEVADFIVKELKANGVEVPPIVLEDKWWYSAYEGKSLHRRRISVA